MELEALNSPRTQMIPGDTAKLNSGQQWAISHVLTFRPRPVPLRTNSEAGRGPRSASRDHVGRTPYSFVGASGDGKYSKAAIAIPGRFKGEQSPLHEFLVMILLDVDSLGQHDDRDGACDLLCYSNTFASNMKWEWGRFLLLTKDL